MRRLSAEIGRPVTFALSQHDVDPDQCREILERCREANAAGAQLAPQVGSRPTMLLIGHQTFHPFIVPADLSGARRAAAGRARGAAARPRDPAAHPRREVAAFADPRLAVVIHADRGRARTRSSRSATRPTTSRRPSTSIAADRRARGPRPVRRALRPDARARRPRSCSMLAILSYSDGDLEALREMLEHPASAFGLGDGGAHCGAICDASMTTFLLTHWARDRTRGPKLPLEWVVRKMTRDTARALRPARPRRRRAGHEGRPERDRLGPPRARAARAGARPAGGRAPPHAARARLRGDGRVGRRDDARRRAHRRAAGPAVRGPQGTTRRGSRPAADPAGLDRTSREVPAAPGSRLAAQAAATSTARRRAPHQHAVAEPAGAHRQTAPESR